MLKRRLPEQKQLRNPEGPSYQSFQRVLTFYLMTMLFWNVRGVNKKRRRKDVMNHIQSHHPDVVGLIETKVKAIKHFRISNAFLLHGLLVIIIHFQIEAESG